MRLRPLLIRLKAKTEKVLGCGITDALGANANAGESTAVSTPVLSATTAGVISGDGIVKMYCDHVLGADGV